MKFELPVNVDDSFVSSPEGAATLYSPPETLTGVIDNPGVILLTTGDDTLTIGDSATPSATLQGGGQVRMAANAKADIIEGVAGAKLTNADNTIFDGGTIGAGGLVLVNAGKVVANGGSTLTLDLSASTASANSGWLGAITGGDLELAGGAVTNTGSLIGNGGAVGVGSGASFTNNGTVAARGGGSVGFAAGALANIAGGALTGGSWSVGAAGDALASTLTFADAFATLGNGASLTLLGDGVVSDGGSILESQLTLIEGHLILGRDYTTTNAISVLGELTLVAGAAATFTSGLLTVAGSVDGVGTIASALHVQQGVTAQYGDITFTGAATVSGDVGGKGAVTFSGNKVTFSSAYFTAAKVNFVNESVTCENLTGSDYGFSETGSSFNLIGELALAGPSDFIGGSVSGSWLDAYMGAVTLESAVTVSTSNLYEEKGGTLKVAENLSYSGSYVENAGTKLIIESGDAFTLANSVSLAGSVSGAGELAFTAGGSNYPKVTIWAGFKISVADWAINRATVTFNAATSYGGVFSAVNQAQFNLAYGSLALNGAATLSNAFVMSSNNKVLFLNGSASVGALNLMGSARLEVNGTVAESGGQLTLGGGTATKPYASLVIGAQGVWKITDYNGVALSNGANAVIVNHGTFERTAGYTSATVAPVFINDGKIFNTASGDLIFKASVFGTGSINIGVGGTQIEFDSAVASTQTVSFNGLGELILGDPTGFKAAIANLGNWSSSQSLALQGDWSVGSFVENKFGTEGVLTLTSGHETATLNLLGMFFDGHFHTTQSSGQTYLTYSLS